MQRIDKIPMYYNIIFANLMEFLPFMSMFSFQKTYKKPVWMNVKVILLITKIILFTIIWTKFRTLYYTNNWIYTTNHKRIAVNYFWFVILSGIIGMVLATVIRLELAYPGVGIFAGDSLQYLSMVTAHGVIMVFFMIMPLLFGAFGNFLLPTQLGVHDVAFPRLNSAAFWFLPAGLIMLGQLVCIDRRYQRMNCFNIREVQSLLKRKFFVDMINTHEYKSLLSNSMISLKYKTNDLNFNNLNTQIFYNFGLEISPKNRKVLLYNNLGIVNHSLKSLNNVLDTNTLLFSNIHFINRLPMFTRIKKHGYMFVDSTDNTLKTTDKCFSWIIFNFFNVIVKLFALDNLIIISDIFSINWIFYIFFYISDNVRHCIFYYNNTICSMVSRIILFFKAETRQKRFDRIVGNFLNGVIDFIMEPIDFLIYHRILLVRSWKTSLKKVPKKRKFNWTYEFFSEQLFIIPNTCVYCYCIFIKSFSDIILNNRTVKELPKSLNFDLLNINDFNPLNTFKSLFNVINFEQFNNLTNINIIGVQNMKKLYNYEKQSVIFKSEYFKNITFKESMINLSIELTNQKRYQRLHNIIFKYDYKSGDYFPKLNKDLYTHLFSTLLDLTSGLRTSPWFYSNNFFEKYHIDEKFSINFNSFYLNMIDNKDYVNTNELHSWSASKFSHTTGFNNFFHLLTKENEFINKRWISFNAVNQKFYKMFLTSSMQQRIYGNWRQLKFTREAWRCKLLAARHQKTLYKRYVNEDGIFWSIERNAKDLLPGWAMITPFSSHTRFTAIGKVDIGLMGVLLVLNSSIVSGANFLVTYRYLSTLNNRKMRDARAFFSEGVMVASWMMIAANPMLVIGIIMLLSDRHWQTSFFDYSGGGDTVLFQHMFWFFGHPEVYVIMIPVFGFTNTIISYYLKKRVSARASLLYSMYTIAFLGFFVWGHHMYMVGLAHTTRMLFSTLTVMISVPAATKLMHWCVTLANSSFTMELPFLFILTFIFFFVSGGISGMCVAHTGMDILFHDTFYVIGHFHVMLAGSAMFGSFGAFYFYFSAIFGVKFSRIYAYLHYTYYLLGQFMTVVPMFWLGYAGMPRRVLDYPASMGGWHSVISAGHLLSVAGLIAFFIMIFDSLRQARAATRNTFGINRYNTRLNFYLYEISRLIFVSRKNFHLFRYYQTYAIQLNKQNYINFEYLETTLYSYTFYKK